MEIDFPKSFKISETEWLFYNIINNSDSVILICPKINISNITIKYKETILKHRNTIFCSENRNISIIFYDLYTAEEYNDIEVTYGNMSKRYNLCKKTKTNKGKLAIATLFDNAEIFSPFYNYYKEQGVGHFYLYFNGSITESLMDLVDKHDVTLIEWNYSSGQTNKKNNVHLCQIHDALYNYGTNHKYMGFCDMNEFLSCDTMSLNSLIKTDKDIYVFHNKWSDTIYGNIPENLPTEFNVDTKSFEKNSDYKIKKVIKTNSVRLLTIYLEGTKYNVNKPSIERGHINYNFYKWSAKNANLTDINTNTTHVMNFKQYEPEIDLVIKRACDINDTEDTMNRVDTMDTVDAMDPGDNMSSGSSVSSVDTKSVLNTINTPTNTRNTRNTTNTANTANTANTTNTTNTANTPITANTANTPITTNTTNTNKRIKPNAQIIVYDKKGTTHIGWKRVLGNNIIKNRIMGGSKFTVSRI